MSIGTWNRIITIEIGTKTHIVVRIENTRQAAECLLGDWPAKSGFYYHRAILACTRALKGELPDEDARFLFTDAIDAAHLPYLVSLNNISLDTFDTEIAAICDTIAFEEQIAR
jgi:hypothetical protein